MLGLNYIGYILYKIYVDFLKIINFQRVMPEYVDIFDFRQKMTFPTGTCQILAFHIKNRFVSPKYFENFICFQLE